jgi:hypothetical protein
MVVDRLRVAVGEGRLTLDEFTDRVDAAIAARTSDDLVPLTSDLPVPVPAAPVHEATGVRRRRRAARHPHDSQRLVNVFGAAHHQGRWRPARNTTVVALMGGCRLDLTACELEPGTDVLELRTFGLFAGIEVLVPAGTFVETSGLLMFGGRHVEGEAGTTPSTLPPVRIRSFGAFGGLLVRTPRRVP